MKAVEEYFRLAQLELSWHNELKKLSKAMRRFASTGFLSLWNVTFLVLDEL
jgi:hypothetical protein